MERLCIGWTTFKSLEDAEKMAGELVEQKLASCVEVEGPLTSYYVWEGKLTQTKEYRLSVHFPGHLDFQVEHWVLKHHPYSLPEWVVVGAEHVSDAYGAWVASVCK